jgi:hypothetical protein
VEIRVLQKAQREIVGRGGPGWIVIGGTVMLRGPGGQLIQGGLLLGFFGSSELWVPGGGAVLYSLPFSVRVTGGHVVVVLSLGVEVLVLVPLPSQSASVSAHSRYQHLRELLRIEPVREYGEGAWFDVVEVDEFVFETVRFEAILEVCGVKRDERFVNR